MAEKERYRCDQCKYEEDAPDDVWFTEQTIPGAEVLSYLCPKCKSGHMHKIRKKKEVKNEDH